MQRKEIVNSEQSKNILYQLENCVCKIDKSNGEEATGFFCKLPYPDQFKLLPVLITNNHVLNEEDLKLYKNIILKINNGNYEKNLMIDPDRITFTNANLDVTIIEIKPFDGILNFLDIDDRIFAEKNFKDLYKNQTIYILHYPSGYISSYSLGNFKNFSKDNTAYINYDCKTEYGSSGSPILSLINHKVIGIHIQKSKFFNQGTFIKYAIDEFLKTHLNSENTNKQIKNENISSSRIIHDKNLFPNIPEWLRLNLFLHKQLYNDLNINKYIHGDNQNNSQNIDNNYIELILFNRDEEVKDLYFLDNANYTDENNVKHLHDNLKELNDSNVDLYINDIKTKFKKHTKFSLGNFKIKIIFKTQITDCKNMFYNCDYIKSIDLSNFDTKEVTDMSGMFRGCLNLRTINLKNFNTEKVNNMKCMFSNCKSLSSLDLSSFNTKNVTDMSSMFGGSFTFSFNLLTLDLSSFDTQNVTNMELMFSGCENIQKIIIPPTFTTSKVISMWGMFEDCKNLNSLDLSSFDTKNVYDMSSIFSRCRNLKYLNLNLTTFDVKNVTFLEEMFYSCDNLMNIDKSKFISEKIKKEEDRPRWFNKLLYENTSPDY